MAFSCRSSLCLCFCLCLSAAFILGANAQLTPTFYNQSCPYLPGIVRNAVTAAIKNDARDAASLIRMFFHDCFVNGCDASILLDDTANFTGEKNAGPNANSVRGYWVIDAIKTQLESACKATVSCTDILALAARDSVNLLGGPSWTVWLGRRDAVNTSQSAANMNLPGPDSSLATLKAMFGAKGLTERDLTALSGAHTVGMARCSTYRARIYNDTNVNATYAAFLKQTCQSIGNDSNLASMDATTPFTFDNAYYQNLISRRGLLHSDQELFNNNATTNALVRTYSVSQATFFYDFATAMIKLGTVSPLTGSNGEIRLNCRKPN